MNTKNSKATKGDSNHNIVMSENCLFAFISQNAEEVDSVDDDDIQASKTENNIILKNKSKTFKKCFC